MARACDLRSPFQEVLERADAGVQQDWQGDPLRVNQYGLPEIWTYNPPDQPQRPPGCQKIRAKAFVIFLFLAFGGTTLLVVISYFVMQPKNERDQTYLIASWKLLPCTNNWKHLLKYATIPLVSIVFTWWHVWLGIKMCFYPVEFVGCCPPVCGWQGIVPRRAALFASRACDLMIGRLLKIEEIIDRIEPVSFFRELQPVLISLTVVVLDKLARRRCPSIWENVPDYVKDELQTKLLEIAPTMFNPVIDDFKANIHNIVDVKDMSIQILIENKPLLVDMFQKIGDREFTFIQHFSATVGFILGLMQMCTWIIIKSGHREEECTSGTGKHAFHCWAGWVLLPGSGLIIGYLTNWLGINLIFRPVWPHLCCGGYVNFQGVFLKRQKQVSRKMTELICKELVTARKMLEHVVKNDEIVKIVKEMLTKHVEMGLEHSTSAVRPLVKCVAGRSAMEDIKDDVVKEILEELPGHSKEIEKYMDNQFDLVNTMSYRLEHLPPSDFEGMLHPVFQEDEWMVLLLGAILGVVVGTLQAWALGA